MIKQQLEDTFEKMLEEGASQTKKAVKSAVQQSTSAFSASKMWEQILGVKNNNRDSEMTQLKENGTKKNHTPLNLDKLGKSYKTSEKQQTETLKQRLFQLVKRGEEEVIFDKEKEGREKKQKEAYELETKKRREQEARQQQSADIPQGKVKKSIFSHKKVAQRQQAEVKPASGKQ